ncbi:MAG: TRAP transporter small permease [Thermoanaerobacteraceae bacterium]|nr:TRAP transporter small permease [Thermoanaerobacteraceae bacterium]
MVKGSWQLGEYIQKIVNNLTFLALSGMVLLVFINVILRYVFNSGFAPSEELARYLFVWTVFLGAITAFKDNQHVGVDLVISRLKGVHKKVVEMIGYALILIALVIMVKGGIGFTILSMSSKGPATGIPFSYISISYVIACVFIGAMVLVKMAKVFGKGER